jgi:excisionase family DNA binding protein
MLRQFLTTGECTLVTGISRARIFEALRSGELKSVKLSGRRRRIRVADLSEWMGAPVTLPAQS